MGEFDPTRTYALKKLQYALVNPLGQPLSLHGSIDLALGIWVKTRGGLILHEADRVHYFQRLNKEGYSIRPANAWCRVGPDPVLKLPKEKPNVKPKVKRARPADIDRLVQNELDRNDKVKRTRPLAKRKRGKR